ncbi:MAG: glycosyltransferase family 4 protein [Desulfatibacillum sp.]|nr:glycosyltransferase family 4 protein [Desulfatibacillum sp.]
MIKKHTDSELQAINGDRPLRVCLLSYRSNPHCGGQGVYVKYLSAALQEIGHHVDVVSGPPYPELVEGVGLHKLQNLDLYNAENPFRMPGPFELADPINFIEWMGVTTMGYPEPFTFGLRAYLFLSKFHQNYDIIHDNQCLAYGIWGATRFLPAVATIHHPITVDRDVAVQSVRSPFKKLKIRRWYSFIDMQKRVSRHMTRVVTVSEASKKDIAQEFPVRPKRIKVVPNGIDTTHFRPMHGVEREKNRLLVTNSADTPLKGLYHLLKAVHEVRKKRDVQLTVIGTPKKNGGITKLVRELGIRDIVTFTGRLDDDAFVREFSRASIAVVPSVYEGFGLPAGEAMACGLPVISTTGGALPEVVGDAGVLVPPADPQALEHAIIDLLDNPEKAQALGKAGYERVHRLFTWKNAAEQTAEVYREAIRAYR